MINRVSAIDTTGALFHWGWNMARRQKTKKVWLVFREERHQGISIYGITSRQDWAESWIQRDGGPSDTMSGPDFDEYILDDPEVFVEASENPKIKSGE